MLSTQRHSVEENVEDEAAGHPTGPNGSVSEPAQGEGACPSAQGAGDIVKVAAAADGTKQLEDTLGGAPFFEYAMTSIRCALRKQGRLQVKSIRGKLPIRFSVQPSLPAGMSLDPNTGTIHGRPTETCDGRQHIVSAHNTHGTKQVPISLHVLEAPGFMRYAAHDICCEGEEANHKYCVQEIPLLACDGSRPLSFAILPRVSNVRIDPGTGNIAINTSISLARTVFTITAGNIVGEASVHLVIEVKKRDGSRARCKIRDQILSDLERGVDWQSVPWLRPVSEHLIPSNSSHEDGGESDANDSPGTTEDEPCYSDNDRLREEREVASEQNEQESDEMEKEQYQVYEGDSTWEAGDLLIEEADHAQLLHSTDDEDLVMDDDSLQDASGEEDTSNLAVGDRVMARWWKDGQYYVGHIERSNDDGSYAIMFDDGSGDYDDAVLANHLYRRGDFPQLNARSDAELNDMTDIKDAEPDSPRATAYFTQINAIQACPAPPFPSDAEEESTDWSTEAPDELNQRVTAALTAWACDFPASAQGKLRRVRGHKQAPRVTSRVPTMAEPDELLDDYAVLSRQALDDVIKNQAEQQQRREAAEERRRAAREERRQLKRAEQLARVEKKRASRLARAKPDRRSSFPLFQAHQKRRRSEDRKGVTREDGVRLVADYYANEDEEMEYVRGGWGLEDEDAEGGGEGCSRTDKELGEGGEAGKRKKMAKADAAIIASAKTMGVYRMGPPGVHRTNKWGRRGSGGKAVRKEGGARQLIDSMIQRLSAGMASNAGGTKGVDSNENEKLERAVQGARADRGQHKKYVGCRVKIRIRSGVWQPAGVTSHLASDRKRYSVMLDNGTRTDLRLPHDNVKMVMTRSPLTTVSEQEKTFARLANMRPKVQHESAAEIKSLIPEHSIGCRARVLYDGRNWHCGWVVSFVEHAGSSRYRFRLRMDDGDYEHVLLPSPDGDVEIVPGFRDKYLAGQHHCWSERDAMVAHGDANAGGGRGESRIPAAQVSSAGRGSSWNRFLATKKGLGLNQTQLKSLYKAQGQSQGPLKQSSFWRDSGGALARSKHHLVKGGITSVGQRGTGHRFAVKRDGRKDSTWNFFLIQNKGLGLTRAELKAKYRKSLLSSPPQRILPAPSLVSQKSENDSGREIACPTNGVASETEGVNGDVRAGGQWCKGKDAWNRFVISKKGLGLNRQQLKTLYHTQRSTAGSGEVERAVGLKPTGRPKGCGPNSSWNAFLRANKGLGLKRGQLQHLYQRSSSGRTRLQLPLLDSQEAGVAARTEAGSRGIGRGRRGGARGMKRKFGELHITPKLTDRTEESQHSDGDRVRHFARDDKGRWVVITRPLGLFHPECLHMFGVTCFVELDEWMLDEILLRGDATSEASSKRLKSVATKSGPGNVKGAKGEVTKELSLPGDLTLGARVLLQPADSPERMQGWISALDTESGGVHLRTDQGGAWVAAAGVLGPMLKSGSLSIIALPKKRSLSDEAAPEVGSSLRESGKCGGGGDTAAGKVSQLHHRQHT